MERCNNDAAEHAGFRKDVEVKLPLLEPRSSLSRWFLNLIKARGEGSGAGALEARWCSVGVRTPLFSLGLSL